MRLAQKVAIVSGGGSGIGRGIALAFAREGAKVVIAGRDTKKLDTVAREIGDACLVQKADISQSSDIQTLVTATLKTFGGVHILVNNAGLLLPGTAESHTEEEWDQTFSINVRGMWL